MEYFARCRIDTSVVSWLFLAFTLCLYAAAADKSKSPLSASQPSYELPQPQRETLDYGMYQRIRDEGLAHSHVMEYASALDDDIGPRLTGSANLKHANEWTRDQFTAMGCSNAHLEDWGEFGMGWQQLNTWVRMTAPDTAVFIAQAAPWSPATNGAINAPAIWIEIKDAKDLDQVQGQTGRKDRAVWRHARRASRRQTALGAPGRRRTEEADRVSAEAARAGTSSSST